MSHVRCDHENMPIFKGCNDIYYLSNMFNNGWYMFFNVNFHKLSIKLTNHLNLVVFISKQNDLKIIPYNETLCHGKVLRFNKTIRLWMLILMFKVSI
jgi:hypothetical protein